MTHEPPASVERLDGKEEYMTDDQIKHMVSRFLMWRLPEHFRPDNGISYTPPTYRPTPDYSAPVGTNLFDATQAEDMVRFMVEGMPTRPINPSLDPAYRKVEDIRSKLPKKRRPA